VRGAASGEDGVGVRGWATNTGDADNYGGFFTAGGQSGRGVYALADNAAGSTFGVFGETQSPDGVGVRGTNLRSGNWGDLGTHGDGVHGESITVGGSGVAGLHWGSGWGVYGATVSGTAVEGWASGETGQNYGGRFTADGEDGIAVYGYASDTSGGDYGNVGGYFRADGEDGEGVFGYAPNSSSTGVVGQGTFSGGSFDDLTSSSYAHVGADVYKIVGTGTPAFVQNHPAEADRVIVYACPEGDEVATYTRGSARLTNGTARIPLGPTFKWVTNPDVGLTAQVTPRGDCNGLYVASLTTDEIVVRELGGGTSDVPFDFLVHGLRIGFEEISIVQEKQREAYIPSMAEHRALYQRRPELRQFNALERFKAMRAATGETEPLSLEASDGLRDVIIEFDPAVHELPTRPAE
jgi:hypothetical protein